MRVVVAGGHGQVALLLERMLVERGVEAVGLVRNPDHVRDLEEVGAEGVVLDLERATAVEGSDAVVFAAGAGPNSGAARKEAVDLGAAVLLPTRRSRQEYVATCSCPPWAPTGST
jgi:putative NADH-flavin reductase